jgi:uncharacterized protein (TIGR02444 family)
MPRLKHPSAADAWDYIVMVYSRPGVSDMCLDWQDRLGADAIIVLWLLWLGSEKSCALNEASLRTIDQCASEWRNATVLPIRLARRASGKLAKVGDQDAAKVYLRLKRIELTAERLSLKRIIREEIFGTHHPDPVLAATTNLELYLRNSAMGDGKSEQNTIARLVVAARSISGGC